MSKHLRRIIGEEVSTMAAFWDSDRKLVLLTLDEFASLPDGEVVTCINGTTATKGVDEIDDDTRAGHMAYGVIGNHPIRVALLETLVAQPKQEFVPPPHRAWNCTIGVMGDVTIRPGADLPMRRAVEKAFLELTGKEAEFNFSGWGAQLDQGQYEVVAGR